jgi:predicted cupin superfamily sugar epimerase
MSEARDSEVARRVELLGLAPHPEGGFYRETYRTSSTGIYFLLPAGDFSAFHRLRVADEMWHHYAGDPVELETIDPDGVHRVTILGPGLERGERPQAIVPAGTLQAAAVRGDRYALCGCTVTPAFDFADFELPTREELLSAFPRLEAVIRRRTRAR